MTKLQKIIFWLFAILLFFVPLVLWPYTSEVFEFNKMVLVYGITLLIAGTWIIRMIIERKFIFRRTMLDTPLIIFLGSQLISTFLSIDSTTSWLGYYSRFNGGLLSTVCYSLLYWAWVSNFGAKETLKLLYVWLSSATLVSIYGVFEHFGIDKSIWVQDVQSRVFSTLGQPNWLAAWLVALIPLTWANAISNFQFPISNEFSKSKKFTNFLIYFTLSILFFWTLIFTKSRSGIFGFGVASIIFWGAVLWLERREVKKLIAPVIAIGISFLIVCLISGTQYTPSLKSFLSKSNQVTTNQAAVPQGTALETGGTESGTIRKIVWTGAIQVFLHYPVFGTGVETFAYSYYRFRPAEHNMTSEWDFIYNKAHNEFLNVAANTGSIGLISYLILIGFSIFIFIQKLEISNLKSQISNKFTNFKIENSLEIGNWKLEIIGLLAGYVGLSATNFFGFSVVPTQLEFFLFPAIAIALAKNEEIKAKSEKIDTTQKVLITLTLLVLSFSLLAIGKYWFADTLYTKGQAYYGSQRPDIAINYLTQAVNLEPDQALYHGDKRALSDSYASLALAAYQAKNSTQSAELTNLALIESQKAADLSPANINLKRVRFGLFVTLSAIDPNYLLNARDTLIDAVTYAPTDAKLFYNLGLVYARTGDADNAIATLKKTVELKADYKDARLAYAILLIDKKQNAEARTQLEYILKNIDPNDSLTKQTLDGIR